MKDKFIICDSNVPQILTLLESNVLGFKESPEYKECYKDADIPGVICASFAKYLIRMHKSKLTEYNGISVKEIISSAYETLELLVPLPETVIKNLITDEIYETMERDAFVFKEFKNHLKRKSLDLYNQWIGKK